MKRIYLEAFPKAERKLFSRMIRLAQKGSMELLAIQEGRKLLGLAFTVVVGNLILLDYFALAEEARGKSYGSQALQLIRERYREKKLIVEIELPDHQASNHEERIRRKNFYIRNGLQETGIYVALCKVPMEILTPGEEISYEEYCKIYEEIMGPLFARRMERL